jgi:hypothetical protein
LQLIASALSSQPMPRDTRDTEPIRVLGRGTSSRTTRRAWATRSRGSRKVS